MASIAPIQSGSDFTPAMLQLAAAIWPRVYKTNKMPPANMLQGITICALAHWDVLEPYYKNGLKYGQAEDLDIGAKWINDSILLLNRLNKQQKGSRK